MYHLIRVYLQGAVHHSAASARNKPLLKRLSVTVLFHFYITQHTGPMVLHPVKKNKSLKDLGIFCNTKHNVHRFTLNFHCLKIMIAESVP